MANVDRPGGFVPVGHLHTGNYNGQAREYRVAASYATALFKGDPVKLTGTSDTTDGVATVEQAAAGDRMVGVIVGIKVDRAVAATEHPGYLPASTGGTVYVVDDPYVIYEVQADDDAANPAATDVGNTADHLMTAGSTTTGRSNAELDSSDIGTGAGWQIIGFSRRQDNEIGASAKLLVKINEHSFAGSGTAV